LIVDPIWTFTLNEKSSVFYLAVACFAMAAGTGLLLAWAFLITDHQQTRRDQIAALIGREVSIGHQKATIIGPYKGNVQLALKDETGSIKTVLVDFTAVQQLTQAKAFGTYRAESE
jgi:hypothetical protein